MNYILFDDTVGRVHLLPLTFTRPIGMIRVGIVTIVEKWQHFLHTTPSILTESYLQTRFSAQFSADNLYINGSVCPDTNLIEAIQNLQPDQKLLYNKELIAVRTSQTLQTPTELSAFADSVIQTTCHYTLPITQIRNLCDIFVYTGAQIQADYQWLTANRTSAAITDTHTVVYNPKDVFLEEGVQTRACILNAETGPIYLGKGAEIQEGSLIRGPFALGEQSVVAMGSKIRGDSTVGPYCKIGGEISNSVILGYSNKGHEGYLGNSILGEWCNLGADTNTSNLKNDYGQVKQWSYATNNFEDTGRQFVGLVMGDHSKAGINTMFNTGTVVGVSANIFGGDFPPKYIPSFSWGGAARLEVYRLDKALAVAKRVMQRRGIPLTVEDQNILSHIFQQTHHEP